MEIPRGSVPPNVVVFGGQEEERRLANAPGTGRVRRYVMVLMVGAGLFAWSAGMLTRTVSLGSMRRTRVLARGREGTTKVD
jgi:hypothetical protein